MRTKVTAPTVTAVIYPIRKIQNFFEVWNMKNSLRLLLAALMLAATFAAATAPIKNTGPLSEGNSPLPTCDPSVCIAPAN